MVKMKMSLNLLLLFSILFGASIGLAEDKPAADERLPEIQLPVSFKSAKIVYDISHPVLSGDVPAALKQMSALVKRLNNEKVKWEMVADFHNESGYMVLNDAAYNKARGVSSGNPHKQLISELASKGVSLEICVETMKRNGWTNKDLLTSVKVNGGALFRLIQLQQQGYVVLTP